MPSPLDAIRIVLVEPAGALNVGSVARVMKNMGLRRLVLVQPHCDWLGAEARQMAVHAPEILMEARVVQMLPQALQGCQRAIATVGRDRHETHPPLELPRHALPWLIPPLADSATLDGVQQSALIFGPEDRGLSNTELQYAHRLVRIPADPGYPSLNLAQAVAICGYELYCHVAIAPTFADTELVGASPSVAASPIAAAIAPEPPPSPFTRDDLASLDGMEAYYQQLETLLLQIGYLYPHTAASRMKKLRYLFNRAQPSEVELAMLRGMIRQISWAIAASPTRPNHDLPDSSLVD